MSQPPAYAVASGCGQVDGKVRSHNDPVAAYRKPSIASRLVYAWFTGLVAKAWRRDLTRDDLFPLNPQLEAKGITDRLMQRWDRQERVSEGHANGLAIVLFKSGAASFAHALAYEMLGEVCSHAIPVLISELLRLLDVASGKGTSSLSAQGQAYYGMGICAALFLVQALHGIFASRGMWVTCVNSMRTKVGLMGLVYGKTISIASHARQDYSLGRTVALMSTNINQVGTAYPLLRFLWFSPAQILLQVAMIYRLFGGIVVWILALVAAAMPLQFYIMRQMNVQRKRVTALTDRRLRFLQETIVGVKVVKYFAWEPIFMGKLKAYRDEELRAILRLMMLSCWSILLNVAVPAFSAVVGFVLYSWEGKPMEAAIVFPVLTYFNMLEQPLSNVPTMASSSVDAFAAMKRLQEFLRRPDKAKRPMPDHSAKHAVVIEDGAFGWNGNKGQDGRSEDKGQDGKDERQYDKHERRDNSERQGTKNERQEPEDERVICVSPSTAYDVVEHSWCPEEEPPFQGLKGMNLQIPRGSLTAIVGPVGSGKSSLLAAIFGEMEQCAGRMVLGGSIGYCPQQPWLLNASVRQNILVDRPFDEERYRQTIRECQMEEDLAALPYGDMTDIGEGGISLSGGQKARLNLARMVYFDRDILLMDDPLSAVDNRVGRAIFEGCIVSGSLAQRTRILVTHHLGVLPQCAHIIVMRHGAISEQGTYADLMRRGSSFAELLARYGEEHRAHPEREEQHQLIDELDTGSGADRCPTPVPELVPPGEEPKASTNWRKEELQARAVSSRAYAIYAFAAGGTGFLVLALLATIANEIMHTGRDVWVDWWVSLRDGFGLGLKHEGFRNAFFVIAALQTLFTWLCGYIFIKGGYWASKYLHDAALQRLLSAPVRFFESTPVGRIINRFGRDLDMVDDQVADSLWYLSYAFGSMVATLVLVLVRIPSAAITFLLPVSLAVLLQAAYRAGSRQLQRLQSTFFSPLMSNFSETYLGLPIIHAFGLGEYFRAKHYLAADVVSQVLFATFALRRWTALYCEFISAALISLTALACFLQRQSSGTTGLILGSLVNFVFSLDWFIKQLADVEAAMLAVERLHQYAVDLDSEATAGAEAEGRSDPDDSWPQQGNVEFRNLSLTYRSGTKPVIEDLCLSIKAGERIGIVGRTGAGKSSIMTALMRAVEWSGGAILLDGVNLGDISLRRLRSRVTIVPQEPILFAGSLRFNLDPTGARTDADLWAALDRVGLKGTASQLPGQLEFNVRDLGENFSLGQRQLFCLARAILRRSRVVMMDEATASMDVETDAMIQRSIREDFQGCTIITIAHRLGTIRDYDRIVVLDAGRIVEVGPPDDLLHDPKSHLSAMFRSGLKPSSGGATRVF